MGTWGSEPKDNDGAWDLIHECDQPIHCVLRRQFKKDPKGVGLAQLVLERGFTVPIDVYKQSLVDLDVCLADKRWLSDWRDPGRAKRAIRRFREKLALLGLKRTRRDENAQALAVLAGEKTPTWVMAPNGWPRVSWDNVKKSWTGIGRRRKRKLKEAA